LVLSLLVEHVYALGLAAWQHDAAVFACFQLRAEVPRGVINQQRETVKTVASAQYLCGVVQSRVALNHVLEAHFKD
jgi:hypothetical protein